MMTLRDLIELITPERVKNSLDPQLYESLTGIYQRHTETPEPLGSGFYGHDDPCDAAFNEETPEHAVFPHVLCSACHHAAIWGYTTLSAGGRLSKPFSNDEKQVIAMALTKRAIYELGRSSLFDANFQTHKKEAKALLDSVMGLVVSGEGGGHAAYVGVSISHDKKTNATDLNPRLRFTRW